MGRAPCCDKANVKKGPWSPEEDAKLKEYIEKQGTGGNWIALPQKVGLKRCGKSCRLRWLNYLRPNIKHGEFSDEEDRVIINLFANIGSRWSIIAAQLPGRTDNDIKNYWNTKLKKKLMGIINSQSPPTQSQSQSQLRKPINNTSSTNISSSSSSSSSSSISSYLLNQPSIYSVQHQHQLSGSMITNPNIFEPNISAFCSMNSLQAPSQESFLSQMQNLNHQAKDATSFMMFGDQQQPSCSSSDGSQYGAEFDHSQAVDGVTTNRAYHNNFHGSGVEERVSNNNNNMISNGSVVNSWGGNSSSQSTDHHHHQVVSDNSVLGYGLEEIKQLISSTNSSTNSSCSNNFLFDENKTDQERVLYYYHY